MLLPSRLTLHRPVTSLTLHALILCVLCAGPARASFVSASANCSGPAGSDGQGSLTPGATVAASIPTCSAGATADYGTLRGSATTSAFDNRSFGSFNTQFSIDFFLNNPNVPANTPTTLTIPLDYHVLIAAGAGASDFSIFLDSAVSPFWLIRFASNVDSNGVNICPSPVATFPRCNGDYRGTLSVNTPALFNTTGPNRFWITMAGQAFNIAGTDASNTVAIGLSTLPDGVTVSYPNLPGNPLNLQTAPGPTAVPEPAAFGLCAAALMAVLVKRRFA